MGDIYTQGQAESGCQRPEQQSWDIADTVRPWCAGKWALGRVLVVLSFEVYLAVHLGMVRSPALSAGVGVGNLGPTVGVGGGQAYRRVLWLTYVSPLSLLPCDPPPCGCFGDTVSHEAGVAPVSEGGQAG